MQYVRPVPAQPDPSVAAGRAARKRFLGEELSPDEGSESPWLVKMVLSGEPPLEITRDGVIPPSPSRVLPLRHGVTAAGVPARCLLHAPGVQRLRTHEDATDSEVDCAACRAWKAVHGSPSQRLAPPVMARIRAAIEDVFNKAA